MCLFPLYAWRYKCLSSNRTCVHCTSHPTIYFLTEFDQCPSSPCMHGNVCASHPTGPVYIVPLTQQSVFLQSLTSAPLPRVCMEVCVPLTQQDLNVTAQEQATEANIVTQVSNQCYFSVLMVVLSLVHT